MPKQGSEILSSITVTKGSHLVPFCSTCIIIRICIIAYMFSSKTNTLRKSFSRIKRLRRRAFHCEAGCISFCNCVTMQVSINVSNLLLWARIKTGGGSAMTWQILFLLYKDARWWRRFCLVKKTESAYCDDGNGDLKRDMTEKKNYIYIYIYWVVYQRDIWINCSGWERCFCGLCNCPVWLETDNILTGAYQTPSAVSALLLQLHLKW